MRWNGEFEHIEVKRDEAGVLSVDLTPERIKELEITDITYYSSEANESLYTVVSCSKGSGSILAIKYFAENLTREAAAQLAEEVASALGLTVLSPEDKYYPVTDCNGETVLCLTPELIESLGITTIAYDHDESVDMYYVTTATTEKRDNNSFIILGETLFEDEAISLATYVADLFNLSVVYWGNNL